MIIVFVVIISFIILFLFFKNSSKQIKVTKSYVITTHTDKGQQRIEFLKKNFSRYKMPPIELHYAIPGKDVDYSVFHPEINSFLLESQISLAYSMYQVLEKIAHGDDEWCYFFEDDARVINVKEGFDLTIIKNVPRDAEMIVFSRGTRDKVFEGNLVDIKETWAGGNMHGQLISKEGAKKLIKALVPIWTANDVQLYKCSCDWKHEISENQTEYDLKRDDEHCKKMGDVKNEKQEPCIKMYKSINIFEQTSNPGRPEKYINDVKSYHELVLKGESDYAIHPIDWIKPVTYQESTTLT